MKTFGEEFENYRKRVNNWKNEWIKEGKILLSSGIKSKQNLIPSIKGSIKYDDGMPKRIGMRFEKQGIWVHLGVGGNYKIVNKGSGVVVNTKGGAMNRKAVPWINKSLNSKLANLTQIVAENNAAFAALGIKHTLEEKVVIRGL